MAFWAIIVGVFRNNVGRIHREELNGIERFLHSSIF